MGLVVFLGHGRGAGPRFVPGGASLPARWRSKRPEGQLKRAPVFLEEGGTYWLGTTLRLASAQRVSLARRRMRRLGRRLSAKTDIVYTASPEPCGCGRQGEIPPEAAGGADFEPEIHSSDGLGSFDEGVSRSIQSTNCNGRATWAAVSFNMFYLTSEHEQRHGEALRGHQIEPFCSRERQELTEGRR